MPVTMFEATPSAITKPEEFAILLTRVEAITDGLQGTMQAGKNLLTCLESFRKDVIQAMTPGRERVRSSKDVDAAQQECLDIIADILDELLNHNSNGSLRVEIARLRDKLRREMHERPLQRITREVLRAAIL